MKELTFLLLFLIMCATMHAQEVMLEDTDSFYPRLIRLAANGQANGRLIASFDVIGAGHIYQSIDDGESWSQIAAIQENDFGHTCCSELYEVPQDLGSTTAGMLFWAVSAHNGTPPASRAIKIYKSADQGNTWNYFSTPVTGNTGLWEAEFSIDDQGRLVMHYASEEHKGAGYNQLIAHRISTDGGATWGNEVIDIGMADNIQRPGMPTVSKLPNGEYVMVYEICGPTYNCDAYIRTSFDGVNWGTKTNIGTRIESVSGNHFSHAPTVTWIDNGTANGELVVAGQVLRSSSNVNATDNGKKYMVNSTNGVGLWAERSAPLFTSSDGTNPCTNYSTQFLSRSGGAEVIQLVNNGCRVYSAIGLFNVPIADGVYRLAAKHSGKVMNVNECSVEDGANVQQLQWAGGDCQRWDLEYLGDGEYKITSRLSGKALDVSECSTNNGGNVQQWSWNGADCQRWYIEPVGQGYYRLVSKNSGKVLDVDACSDADGQNVQLWEWLGGDCQQWKIEPVSPNEVPTGSFRIISKNSGMALNVSDCSANVGGNVQQWPWNGANCQRWTITAKPDGYYEIISNRSGLALDVDGCLSTNGRNVQTWTSNGAACQRWGFKEVEQGYYKIISKNGLKVLDVEGCSAAEGANVQQWQGIDGDCQLWALEPVSQSQPIVGGLGALKNSGIKIYPNPAKEKIEIVFDQEIIGKVVIAIVDNAGKECIRKTMNLASKSSQLQIDTKAFAKGIYYLNISSAEINYAGKIIKD